MRIRPEVVKLYKGVHSWTGLICGLLLFVAFYAGALTMFTGTLAAWAEPPRATIALADVPALLDRIVAERPEAGEEIHLYVGDSHAEPRFFWWDPETNKQYVASLGPDGRLDIGPPYSSRLARSVDLIHRAGGLPIDRDTSLTIMGVVALLYFVAILSGLIIVLKSLVRDLFALRVGRNLKRMWLDAHNVVGIVSLPFHLFMAISTAAFAFDADILNLQDRFVYAGRLDEIVDAAVPAPADAGKPSDGRATMLPPAALIERVRAISPGFEAETITYIQPGRPHAAAIVAGRDPADLSARNTGVTLEATTGRVLDESELPRRGTAWNAMVAGFSALHFGTFGGTPVRWFYFLLGLGGAFLFYSGNLLWIESRRRRAGSGRRADLASRLMASATTGIAFGCIAGLSLSIASAKWFPAAWTGLAGWHSGLFHAGLAMALLAAFAFGPGRSVAWLMAFAAAATAAIPLTSLAAVLVPGLGLWNSPGALGVDLVAGAGALALAWGARATARRIAAAPPESVWSRAPGAGPPPPGAPIVSA
ncbi:MAG TPA: PepSY-associated TM helix domain-containing protein [Allosphingosinicella sp.]|nr:PepSY-associated TM helix domain-containing protein [Allosphingosinicella sp.]